MARRPLRRGSRNRPRHPRTTDKRSGLETIKCASTMKPSDLQSLTKSGPKLRLGTKWPSITSTETQVTPAAFTACNCSPRRENQPPKGRDDLGRLFGGHRHRSRSSTRMPLRKILTRAGPTCCRGKSIFEPGFRNPLNNSRSPYLSETMMRTRLSEPPCASS